MENLVDRLVGALKLDPAAYREIGADQSATGQAVLVTAVATAIANITGEGNILVNIIGGAVFGVIGLFIWTGILFLLSRLFGAQGDYLSLARGIGFSAAPYALAIIPFLGIIGGIYSIIMQIRAVQEIYQISTGKAVAVVLIPWAVLIILGALVFAAVLAALVGMGT